MVEKFFYYAKLTYFEIYNLYVRVKRFGKVVLANDTSNAQTFCSIILRKMY